MALPRAANGVDALANEPVVCDGEMAGRVTSGRVRHQLNASIAPGCVPTWLSERTDGFQIEIPGVFARRRHRARTTNRSHVGRDAKLTFVAAFARVDPGPTVNP